MKKTLFALLILSFGLAVSGAIGKIFFSEIETEANYLLLSSVIFSAITALYFLFVTMRMVRKG